MESSNQEELGLQGNSNTCPRVDHHTRDLQTIESQKQIHPVKLQQDDKCTFQHPQLQLADKQNCQSSWEEIIQQQISKLNQCLLLTKRLIEEQNQRSKQLQKKYDQMISFFKGQDGGIQLIKQYIQKNQENYGLLSEAAASLQKQMDQKQQEFKQKSDSDYRKLSQNREKLKQTHQKQKQKLRLKYLNEHFHLLNDYLSLRTNLGMQFQDYRLQLIKCLDQMRKQLFRKRIEAGRHIFDWRRGLSDKQQQEEIRKFEEEEANELKKLKDQESQFFDEHKKWLDDDMQLIEATIKREREIIDQRYKEKLAKLETEYLQMVRLAENEWIHARDKKAAQFGMRCEKEEVVQLQSQQNRSIQKLGVQQEEL